MSGSKTYRIKTGARPSGHPANYNYTEIQTLLEATDHEKVSTAGAAYNDAARIVGMVAHELYVVGTKLSEKWEGADADAAQKALGQLYATANELFGRSQQAGAALQTYGAALKQFKGLQWPNWPTGGASPAEDEGRQTAANRVMQAVNHQIAAAWDAMPDKVQQNLPTLGGHRRETPYSPGVGSPRVGGGVGGGGGGGGAPTGGRLPHSPRLPHVPRGSENGLPTIPDGGHGADLAGGGPSTGGGLGTTPPHTGNPLPSGLSGGAPSSPVGGLTSGGIGGPSLLPGSGAFPRGGPGSGRVPSESGMSSAEEVAASRAAAVEEAEASQAARGVVGAPGAPGATGGAAGTTETERERTTWLAEEEATWGAEEDVIGQALGTPTAAGSDGKSETELRRKSWLGEDEDVWTGGETAGSGTIGEAPPRHDEAVAGEVLEVVKESDILDPERLQELLDVIIAPEEETAGTSKSAASASPGLLDDLGVEEVNDIDRLLNG
ncbi:hypothetical protein [Actinoallomurus sp. NPDC052274]|uniref:hypothetical protein n=1 Tax=Actinoallomurus sp. NPDC052274 TaxID=3155420 RepID=UPI0034325DDE